MYATVALKKDTKKILDDLKQAMGTKSYDETVLELARGKSFLLLKDLKGILKGAPPFERDHRERSFA